MDSSGSQGLSDVEYLPENYANRKKPKNLRKFIPGVRGIEIYDSTVKVKRHEKQNGQNNQRGSVLNLSRDSLGNLAFIAFNTPAIFPSLMTLTYPGDFSNDGQKVKRDLDVLLKWYARNFAGEKYLWWLEFQKRGAPHFHVLSTLELGDIGSLATIHRKDGSVWETHWETWQALETAWARAGGGMTAWEVVNDPEGGKKYAAKYATKAYQKAVPPEYRNVGRFWGHSRSGVKPDPSGFYECSEEQLREALRSGDWSHLPDDGALIYRELFQAADKISLAQLNPVNEFPVSKKTKKTTTKSSYVCESCGVVSDRWSGQCGSCENWDSLVIISQEPVKNF